MNRTTFYAIRGQEVCIATLAANTQFCISTLGHYGREVANSVIFNPYSMRIKESRKGRIGVREIVSKDFIWHCVWGSRHNVVIPCRKLEDCLSRVVYIGGNGGASLGTSRYDMSKIEIAEG